MGFFDRLRFGQRREPEAVMPPAAVTVGALTPDDEAEWRQSYNNSNITFKGE